MTGIVNSTGAKSGIIGTTVGTPSGGAEYEEGSWTPTNNNGSFGNQNAYYAKVGRLVYIEAWVYTTGGSAPSTNQILGFPFTSEENSGNAVGGGIFNVQNNAENTMTWARASNTTYADIRDDGGKNDFILATGKSYYFTGCFISTT